MTPEEPATGIARSAATAARAAARTDTPSGYADVFRKALTFTRAEEARASGFYPYFIPIGGSEGTEVMIDGHKLIMIGSNNYLGLTHDPRVLEYAEQVARHYGTGCTGSRFLNGTLGMFFDSRRGTPTFRTITDFDWDVAPLPNGSQPASILHSDGYCMAAGSKSKEAAWKLIEFANSQPGQELMAKTGRTVPSMRAVAESAVFLEPENPPANSQVWVDIVPTVRQVPTMPGWVAIEDAASAEIERAFYGQATVEEAAAAAVARTKELFPATAQP